MSRHDPKVTLLQIRDAAHRAQEICAEHVSGIAAAMSIKNQSSVQNIDVADLQKRITAVGIPLESPE